MPSQLKQMVKRTLSICFLFLAGFILVGHTIIPHHHHIKFCGFVNEVVSHNHEHDCLTPFCKAYHHDGSAAKHCVLEQTVVIRTGALRNESLAPLLSSFHGHPASGLLFSAFLNTDQYHYITESALFRHFEYRAQTCFRLFQFIEFRGPPVA